MKNSPRLGFTLIELLVVIGIIGILVAIAIPNITRFRTQAREAEVKNNVKSIHEALQRYSTDNSGIYPPWINGGDWTDSWNLPSDPEDGDVDFAEQFFQRSYTDLFSNTGISDTPNWLDRAAEGDGDALIFYGYFTVGAYPKNPFQNNSIGTDLRDRPRNTVEQVSGGVSSERAVAGFQNDLMWEISGGPPQTGLSTGDGSVRGHPGWEFLFPAVAHNPNTNEIDQSLTDSGPSLRLPGNFYYYGIPKRVDGVEGWYDYEHSSSSSPLTSESANGAPVQVDQYYLLGYGGNLAGSNTKADYYDNYGEFRRHARTFRPDDNSGTPVEPVNEGPGGPDGIGDGAVILLTGGDAQAPVSE